jgi:hypothetical protein
MKKDASSTRAILDNNSQPKKKSKEKAENK